MSEINRRYYGIETRDYGDKAEWESYGGKVTLDPSQPQAWAWVPTMFSSDVAAASVVRGLKLSGQWGDVRVVEYVREEPGT